MMQLLKLLLFPNLYLQFYAEEGDGGGDSDGGDADSGDGGGGGANPGDGPDDGSGGEGGEGNTSAYWPEDWQAKLAGEDPKLAERAGRFTDPKAMFDSLVATQNKLRSGEYLVKLPENATEDEVKAWRKEIGIPEEPSGYKLEGIEIPEEDQEGIDNFRKVALENNLTPDQAKAAVQFMYQHQQSEVDKMLETDDNQKQEVLDKLNIEWGNSFRRHMNGIENLINRHVPEASRELFKNARLPDGSALMNNIEIVKALAGIEAEINPANIMTSVDGDSMKGVEEEIKEIEGFMAKDRAAYNKDADKQARLRELYGVREKLQTRKAG